MPSATQLEIENIDKDGSNSFEASKDSGEEGLSKSEYVEDENKNKIFKLKDFLDFYEALMQRFGVQEIATLLLHEMPKVNTKSRNTISSKSISIITDKARRYLFCVFQARRKWILFFQIKSILK